MKNHNFTIINLIHYSHRNNLKKDKAPYKYECLKEKNVTMGTSRRTVVCVWTRLRDFGQLGQRDFFVPTLFIST